MFIDTNTPAKPKTKTKAKGSNSFFFTLLIIILAIPLVLIGYELSNGEVMEEKYSRICSLPEESGIKISGYRNYLDTGKTFLDYRYKNIHSTEQETYILNNVDVAIALINPDGSWGSVMLSGGGEGYTFLPKAKRYAFSSKDNVWVMDYEELCKEVY